MGAYHSFIFQESPMKRVRSVLLMLIFSLSFFLAPMPAQAQAETPPPPAVPAADLPEGVFQDGEGLLFAQEESLTAQGQEPAAPRQPTALPPTNLATSAAPFPCSGWM